MIGRRRISVLFIWVGMALWLMGACSEESSGGAPLVASNEDTDLSVDSGVEYYTPNDFDAHCYEQTCDFDLVEGERMSRGVATWHAGDRGFVVEGNPAVISVSDRYAAHPEVPVKCYKVRVLGNWDRNVELFFEVDGEYGIFGLSAAEKYAEEQNADDTELDISSDYEGIVHFSQKLNGRDWQVNTLEIHTLKHRGQLDFSVRKEGEGDALFYLIKIDGERECTTNAINVD